MLDPNGFNELKLCRTGPLLFNKNDWPIGASLKAYGEFSWSEVKIFEQVIGSGQLVIDAGANIGVHTVRMSQLVGPQGKVLAFEPQRIAFQTMCANLALNHCTNVHAFHAAVGNRSDTILVPVRNQYEANNFGGVPLAGVTDGESVLLVTIDGMNLRMCHFIKADLEGMEGEFLDGAKATIFEHRPLMYLEGDGAQAKQSIEMLFGWRYRLFWHAAPLFNPENFAGNNEHIFMHGESEVLSINMICIPEEMKVAPDGFVEIHSSDEDPLAIENERRKSRKEAAVG